MARITTLGSLITRIDELADITNNTSVSRSTKVNAINSALSWLWDKLVESAPPHYYLKKVALTTTPGQLEYDLDTIFPDGDFYKLSAVYVNEQNGVLRPLQPIQDTEVMPYRAPQAAVPLQLQYIPCAPVLVDDEDELDTINGWDELILMRAIMDIKAKREEDNGPYFRKAKELEERIYKMAYRDSGAPQRVTRRRNAPRDIFWWTADNVNGYMLKAGNLELYSFNMAYPWGTW